MESALTALITEMVKYGAPGIAIAYLIWKIHRLEGEAEERQKRIEELFEQRVTAAIQAAATHTASTAAQDKIGDALQKISTQIISNSERLHLLEQSLRK